MEVFFHWGSTSEQIRSERSRLDGSWSLCSPSTRLCRADRSSPVTKLRPALCSSLPPNPRFQQLWVRRFLLHLVGVKQVMPSLVLFFFLYLFHVTPHTGRCHLITSISCCIATIPSGLVLYFESSVSPISTWRTKLEGCRPVDKSSIWSLLGQLTGNIVPAVAKFCCRNMQSSSEKMMGQ